MGYLFAVFSAMAYGINDILIHMGTKEGRANTTQALTVNLIAGNLLLLLTTLVAWLSGSLPPINAMGLLFFVAAGISAPLFGRVFSFSAIKHIGATRTTSLRVSETLFTMLLAVVFLRDSLSLLAFTGAVILMGGVVIIIQESSQLGQASNTASRETAATAESKSPAAISSQGYFQHRIGLLNVGTLLALGAGFAFALGGVFRQVAIAYIPSALLGSAIGTFVALVVNMLNTWRGGHFRNWNLTRREIGFYALGGIANTSGMLFFFYALLAGSSVSITAALKNTSPLFTLFLSLLILRKSEAIQRRLVASVFMVVIGAWMIVYF